MLLKQTSREWLKSIPVLGGILVYINQFRKRLFIKAETAPEEVSTEPQDFNDIRRNTIYLGDYKALTRTVFGQKMLVDTRDLSLTPHILMDGYWEMWITKFFMETMQEGMNVIEIGTNIGYYTLLAASKIGSHGKLFAFEANPEIYDILFQNISINGFSDQTVLVNNAVVDKSKTLKFHTLLHHKGSSSISEFDDEFLRQHHDQLKTIEVNAISLDEYFAEIDTKIDLIKIDAEGSESLIFKGMGKIIKDNPEIKIICEFAPDLISDTGENPKDFLEKILELGFNLDVIDTNSNLTRVSLEELLKIPHCDLFLSR